MAKHLGVYILLIITKKRIDCVAHILNTTSCLYANVERDVSILGMLTSALQRYCPPSDDCR